MKILMVCLGNICRSPMAEAIFREKADPHWLVDSAGTSGYHDGELPHHGTQKILNAMNINYQTLYSRRIKTSDFETFDYIFVMDANNYNDLMQRCDAKYHAKIHRFHPHQDIPDPWYTGDFQETKQLVIEASDYWLQKI